MFRSHLAPAATVLILAALAGGSASAAERDKLPPSHSSILRVGSVDGAVEECDWLQSYSSVPTSAGIAVFNRGLLNAAAWCVDDINLAAAGCDMVEDLEGRWTPERGGPKVGVIVVDDDGARWIPCEEVAEVAPPLPAPPTPVDTIVPPNVCYIDGKAHSEGQRHDGQVCKCYREDNFYCLWE